MTAIGWIAVAGMAWATGGVAMGVRGLRADEGQASDKRQIVFLWVIVALLWLTVLGEST